MSESGFTELRLQKSCKFCNSVNFDSDNKHRFFNSLKFYQMIKKIFFSFWLLITLGMSIVVFNSCGKDDDEKNGG